MLIQFEPVRQKTNNLGFRPGPTQTHLDRPVQSHEQARTLKFRIEEEVLLHYLWSENKGADQPCSYCTADADLRLCFGISALLVFLCSGSFNMWG